MIYFCVRSKKSVRAFLSSFGAGCGTFGSETTGMAGASDEDEEAAGGGFLVSSQPRMPVLPARATAFLWYTEFACCWKSPNLVQPAARTSTSLHVLLRHYDQYFYRYDYLYHTTATTITTMVATASNFYYAYFHPGKLMAGYLLFGPYE